MRNDVFAVCLDGTFNLCHDDYKLLTLGAVIKEEAVSRGSTVCVSSQEFGRGYADMLTALPMAVEHLLPGTRVLQPDFFAADFHRGLEQARRHKAPSSCRIGDFSHLVVSNKNRSSKAQQEKEGDRHSKTWRTGLFKTCQDALADGSWMERMPDRLSCVR